MGEEGTGVGEDERFLRYCERLNCWPEIQCY